MTINRFSFAFWRSTSCEYAGLLAPAFSRLCALLTPIPSALSARNSDSTKAGCIGTSSPNLLQRRLPRFERTRETRVGVGPLGRIVPFAVYSARDPFRAQRAPAGKTASHAPRTGHPPLGPRYPEMSGGHALAGCRVPST